MKLIDLGPWQQKLIWLSDLGLLLRVKLIIKSKKGNHKRGRSAQDAAPNLGPANLLLSHQSGKTALKVRDVTNKRKHTGRKVEIEVNIFVLFTFIINLSTNCGLMFL